jgi:hypothetical protein
MRAQSCPGALEVPTRATSCFARGPPCPPPYKVPVSINWSTQNNSLPRQAIITTSFGDRSVRYSLPSRYHALVEIAAEAARDVFRHHARLAALSDRLLPFAPNALQSPIERIAPDLALQESRNPC